VDRLHVFLGTKAQYIKTAPLLRLLAPGAEGQARISVYGPDGRVVLRGASTVDLEADAVTDVPLGGLPAGTYAVVVDADVPVTGAARYERAGTQPDDSVVTGTPYDVAWSRAQAAPAASSGRAPLGMVALPGGTRPEVTLAGVPGTRDPDAHPAGAAPVTPLLRLSRDAALAADRTLGAALVALPATGVDPLLDDPAAALAARAECLADRIAATRAALPREADLADLERAHSLAVTTTRSAEKEVEELATERTALPRRIHAARESLADAAVARSSLTAVRDELARADERLAACRVLVDLEPVLATARDARADARTVLADARERWLVVREARLEGMAAELASRLAVGDSCPVCGSAAHPRPASAASGAPDAAAEKEARRVVDDAEADLHLCDEELRATETEVALARQRAGDAVSTATPPTERAARAPMIISAPGTMDGGLCRRPVEFLDGIRRLLAPGGVAIIADPRANGFAAPGNEVDRLLYAASVLCCLPVGLAEQPSVGTGTMIEAATMQHYGEAAGFARVSVLDDIDNPLTRFYRMDP
jgi:hypothetical protein